MTTRTPLVGSAAAPEFADLTDLTGAVRDLMDAAGCTRLEGADLRTAAESIRAVARDLGRDANPRPHKIRLVPHEVQQMREGKPWQAFPFNPQGIPFAIQVDGSTGRAEMLPTALHEGPPDLLHGGFSAAMIDAFLGTLVQVAVEPSFTATLDLRYVGPVQLDEPVEITGRVVSRSGRKVHAECEIRQHGEARVTARGLFVAVAGSGVTSVERQMGVLRGEG